MVDIEETIVFSTTIGSDSALGTHSLTLWSDKADGAAPFVTCPPTPGHYEINLTPVGDWVSRWSTIMAELMTGSSLNQQPNPPFSAFNQFNVKHSIEQTYLCINVVTGESTTQVVNSAATAGNGTTQCGTNPADPRTVCTGQAEMSSIFFKSRSLNLCDPVNGCYAQSQDFQPVVRDNAMDPSSSGQMCLCATGGTGDYQFSILSGHLAGGETLNKDTGCIEGTPDGVTVRSDIITFQVTDRGGGGLSGGTPARTVGGTCRVFGTGASHISGGAWTADMVGGTITIGGSPFTVVSVDVALQNIVLSAVAGIHDPIDWSFTFPAGPAPTPAPPETATVECSFLGPQCPGGEGTAIGNVAY